MGDEGGGWCCHMGSGLARDDGGVPMAARELQWGTREWLWEMVELEEVGKKGVRLWKEEETNNWG